MENENIIKALHDLQFLENELRAIAQDADKLKALNAELVANLQDAVAGCEAHHPKRCLGCEQWKAILAKAKALK